MSIGITGNIQQNKEVRKMMWNAMLNIQELFMSHGQNQ